MNTNEQAFTSLQYLLLPSPPTPNGRLHLGHIGGPYLTMDVLKRGLEMQGHQAAIVLTLDAYESFMMLAAKERNDSVENTLEHFADLIKQDLQALLIDAVLINPLAPDWNENYRRYSNDAIKQLDEQGQVVKIQQGYFYDPQGTQCIASSLLLGVCPNCGLQVSGDCCDGCSALLTPQTLLDPRARFDNTPLVMQQKQCLYYVVEDVEQAIEQINIDPKFKPTISNHWQLSGNKIRLTVPSLDWGLPMTAIDMPECTTGSDIFSYASLGLYLSSGAYLAAKYDSAINPFNHPDSRIIMGFGIDNLIHMSYINTLLLGVGYQGFDQVLPNYFMSLNNKKFSTSSKHALWAAEFVERSNIAVDDLRFYLAKISPQEQSTNFCFDTLQQCRQDWQQNFNRAMNDAFAALSEGINIGAYLPDLDIQSIEQQLRYFYHEQGFSLLKISAHLQAKLQQLQQLSRPPINSAQQPLKAIAGLVELTLMLYPVMPQCAQKLWSSLGFTSTTPSVAGLYHAIEQGVKPLQILQLNELHDLDLSAFASYHS